VLWEQAGFDTPRHVLLDAGSKTDAVVEALGLPLIVKPAREGSTIGLSKVVAAADLPAAYELAARHDSMVLAEQYIAGMELTVGILEETPLPLVRIRAASGLYDYHAKYVATDTRYDCPSGLPAAEEEAIQAQALKAYRILGCEGWGRVDVIRDEAGKAYLIEANTSPGMTSHSLVPMAAKAAGIPFDRLVLRILELAHVG
jgi:D-alanine-D-alanine ligase